MKTIQKARYIGLVATAALILSGIAPAGERFHRHIGIGYSQGYHSSAWHGYMRLRDKPPGIYYWTDMLDNGGSPCECGPTPRNAVVPQCPRCWSVGGAGAPPAPPGPPSSLAPNAPGAPGTLPGLIY